MTDEQNEQREKNETPAAGEGLAELGWTDRVSAFLNTTEPARLLMWSALAIFLAAVCTYFGIQMQYGLNGSSMLGLWQGGEHVSMEHASMDPYGGRSPLPPVLGKVLASLGFVFGIAGTLLPMWTVGRLISDAIKEGNRS